MTVGTEVKKAPSPSPSSRPQGRGSPRMKFLLKHMVRSSQHTCPPWENKHCLDACAQIPHLIYSHLPRHHHHVYPGVTSGPCCRSPVSLALVIRHQTALDWITPDRVSSLDCVILLALLMQTCRKGHIWVCAHPVSQLLWWMKKQIYKEDNYRIESWQ